MISVSMELVTELVNNQFTLCIPIALVLIGGILVFTFGFKSAQQPPFDKLTSSNVNDDRKPAGKKRKTKEKKPTVNGQVVNGGETKTDKSPKRLPKETVENQKSDNLPVKSQGDHQKKTKEAKEPVKNKRADKTEEVKAKKAVKAKNEKPVDFDDGSWETVPAKGDKKKKQESPGKKDKKYKKIESFIAMEKSEQNVSPDLSEVDNNNKESEVVVAVAPVTEKEETFLGVEIVEIQKENAEEEEVQKDTEDSDLEIPPAVEIDKEIVTEEPPEEENNDKQQEGSVAFDELGDIWTEAKVVKKSKKKSRREI